MDINLGKYAKFIVAFLAALGVLGAALADGHINNDEFIALISAFAGAAAVFAAPNKK